MIRFGRSSNLTVEKKWSMMSQFFNQSILYGTLLHLLEDMILFIPSICYLRFIFSSNFFCFCFSRLIQSTMLNILPFSFKGASTTLKIWFLQIPISFDGEFCHINRSRG